MNKIPVYYHIPKCGGTYLLNIMRGWCDRQGKKESVDIKTITIQKENRIVYRVFSIFTGNSKYVICTSRRDLLCNLEEYVQSKGISDKIFFVIVEPDADWTNLIQDLSLQNYDLSHFLILREPFSRTRSLFNYLNKDESAHEVTHNTIAKDFQEFLESYQYEDSFVIRKFASIDYKKPINQDDYKQVLEYFKSINMQVGNMTNIMETFNKILTSCNMFNINVKNISNDYFVNNQKLIRNQTDYLENRQLEDFPQVTIDFFKDRTKFDQRLYDHYANITQT